MQHQHQHQPAPPPSLSSSRSDADEPRLGDDRDRDRDHHHHHRRRGGGGGKARVLFYAVAAFAACWLQLSANVFVYFYRNDVYRRGGGGVGGGGGGRFRFPSEPQRRPERRRHDGDAERGTTAAGGGGDANSNSNATTRAAAGDLRGIDATTAALGARLTSLRRRFESLERTLGEEIRKAEEASWWSSSTGPSPSPVHRRIFLPFTIRDASRTVPTQIPHGFEVFDFVDLSEESASATGTTDLYHNGKPVASDGGDPDDFDDGGCRGYSKECYRSKFLRVLRYLLDLPTAKHGSTGPVEYYYFYVESDNDLCVPLEEIRDLAFRHRRYFVATGGTGASGWIMSRRFLEDFASFWSSNANENANANESVDAGNGALLSPTELLEPDSVAAALLKRKRAWSVTRRYLTSHSILTTTEGGGGASSIAGLFEIERREGDAAPKPGGEAAAPGSAATAVEEKEKKEEEDAAAGGDDDERKKKKKANADRRRAKKLSPEEQALAAPLMEPSRYLPRCLEPHRGVWRTGNDGDGGNGFDVHHWGFFDYDLCPDSDIFPCEEGQLEDLAARDPHFS